MSTKSLSALGILSLGFAVTIGLLDRETTSFTSLFDEPGNWAGLALYASFCFLCGLATLKLYRAVRRTDS